MMHAIMLHCLAAVAFATSPAEQLHAAHQLVSASDEAAIDRLIEGGQCEHFYLDVGTNVGVQLRKLFEPHLYPHAEIHDKFNRVFGRAIGGTRCNVCAIGVEPNPRHAARLQTLQAYLRDELGANVLILAAAASDADGVTTLASTCPTRTQLPAFTRRASEAPRAFESLT